MTESAEYKEIEKPILLQEKEVSIEFLCPHCNERIKTEKAHWFMWERNKSDGEWIVCCNKCGTRRIIQHEVLEATERSKTVGNHKKGDSNAQRKSFYRPFLFCILVILAIWSAKHVLSDMNANTAPLYDIKNVLESTSPISIAYADDRHYYGNSFENISQGGTMVAYGEWIYYSDVNGDSTIWKMKQDGSEKKIVLDVPALHMSIHNDWLYYRSLKKGYLCRFSLKDEIEEILVKRDIYEPKIVGNYIYYEDASDNSYDLYRIDVDGQNEKKLTDGVVFYCCVTDKRIYYLDTAENRKGYSVNLDGEDKQLWYAGRVGTIDYVDGKVYFTDAENGGLYSLDPDNGEIVKISSFTMRSINIYNGDVYYADGKNDGALTKTSLSSPDDKLMLSSDKCELINVCGGWVQYHIQGYDEDEEFYWVSTDGSKITQFS